MILSVVPVTGAEIPGWTPATTIYKSESIFISGFLFVIIFICSGLSETPIYLFEKDTHTRAVLLFKCK